MADWRDWFGSSLWPGGPVHPDSPAGGSGPGHSYQPGTLGTLNPPLPHPDSPAGRFFDWQLELPSIDKLERAKAVYQALVRTPKYVPKALWEATGMELHEVVAGIIPGLVMCVGIMAATTALGAAIGAIIGFFAGGVGAAPGAAAGAGVGFEAGTAILEFLGIAFLIGYIGKSLVQSAIVAKDAVVLAWNAVDHPAHLVQVEDHAAHRMALAIGLIFRGILQGLVAFLLAKGSAAAASRVPELVGNLRRSKLGAGFAAWVEANWQAMIKNPKLQEVKTGGGAVRKGGGGDAATPSELRRAAGSGGEPPPDDAPPPATGPGSAAHKAARWKEYVDDGGSWDYDRWSKVYDANMVRARQANAAVDAYRDQIGWGDREVTVPVEMDGETVARRLDIADLSLQKGIEYKTGYVSASEDIVWEVDRDAQLVKDGWDIEWVFRDSASQPLLDRLDAAGISYKVGP